MNNNINQLIEANELDLAYQLLRSTGLNHDKAVSYFGNYYLKCINDTYNFIKNKEYNYNEYVSVIINKNKCTYLVAISRKYIKLYSTNTNSFKYNELISAPYADRLDILTNLLVKTGITKMK